MKELLLSMKPVWYNLVETGEKVYEYRKHFPEERVRAYIYVSSPIKQVVGIIDFGERISLESWKNKFENNQDMLLRINNYLERNNFAVQILKVKKIRPISLESIRKNITGFIAPQMYYCLDNNLELKQYLHNNTKDEVNVVNNDFCEIGYDDICKNYRIKGRR